MLRINRGVPSVQREVSVERPGSKQTNICDQKRLAFCPGDFAKLSPPSPPPHPLRTWQPLGAGGDTYKSFPACALRGEDGESFLFTLANVLQVLPWGSVIVGHLRHRWREGNYWDGLPKRSGGKGGGAENEEHTCVCMRRLAHARTHTHLKAVWHPHPLTFSVSCSGLWGTHFNEQNHTCMCIKHAHMHK